MFLDLELQSWLIDAQHAFASTQINLPPILTAEVLAFASKIPDAALTEKGRETIPHVTIKYGIHTSDAEEVTKVFAGVDPIPYTLGRVSVFEQPDVDVVKVEVISPALHVLNAKVKQELDVTDTYPVYDPHVTLAYLKPGFGARYVGDTTFQGKQAVANCVYFSTADDVVTEIPLGIRYPQLEAAGGAGSGNFGHAGRPGEVGGSAFETRGKGEFYHGTSKFNLDSILKRGLLASYAGRVWDISTPGHVFMSKSLQKAITWGKAASRDIVVLKVRLPPSEVKKLGGLKFVGGGTDRHYEGDIKPEWIIGHQEYKHKVRWDGEESLTRVAEDSDDIIYVAVKIEDVGELLNVQEQLAKTLVSKVMFEVEAANDVLLEFLMLHPESVDAVPSLLGLSASELFLVLGGPGSGNFDHAGRPGEVGGSSPNLVGLEPKAVAVDSGKFFDIKRIGVRRFMYNPDSNVLILGAEGAGDPNRFKGSDNLLELSEFSHADALDAAFGRRVSGQEYDKFWIHGYLGTGYPPLSDTGGPSSLYGMYGTEAHGALYVYGKGSYGASDGIDKLLKKVSSIGGVTGDTLIGGDSNTEKLKDSDWSYLFKKRKRAAEAVAPWKALHAAADAHYGPMRKMILRAFQKGQAQITEAQLAEAIKSGEVDAVLAPVLDTIEAQLKKGIVPLSLTVLGAGGTVGAAQLQAAVRTAEFDPNQPRDEQGQWTTGASDTPEHWRKFGKVVSHFVDTYGPDWLGHMSKLTQDEFADLYRAAGGAGSGNFGHAGRPGEIGGSAHEALSDPDAQVVRKSFDMKAISSRRFLFNPTTKQLVLGKERASMGQEESSHADALFNALPDATPRLYDKFTVHGFVGKDFGMDKGPKIVISSVFPSSSDENSAFDDIGKLVEYFANWGGADSNTYLHGGGLLRDIISNTTIGESPFSYATQKRKRAAGGAGSGNFGHAGRPGEVGGSADFGPATAANLPEGAVKISPWQHFDITKVRERRFLFNPKTNELVLGNEIEHDAWDQEETHAAALDSAMDGNSTPQQYDAFYIHGFLGTWNNTNYPHGRVSAQNAFGGRASDDDLAKLFDKLRVYGNVTGETAFGPLESPVGRRFPDVFGKRKRAAGGKGSGNFGHAGRPGEVGGSADATGGASQLDLIPYMASSLDDMTRAGNWKLTLTKKPGDYEDTHTYAIEPKQQPERIKEHDGKLYDPELAHVVDGRIQPLTEDVLPQKEDGFLYRGMTTAEWQQAQERGYFESLGTHNLGDSQKGLTYFSVDPSQAESYASGFAPWQFKPSFERPAILVKIKDPGNTVLTPGEHSERGVPGRVALGDVVDTYEGRPYQIQPGFIDFYRGLHGKYTEGSRSSPRVFQTWRKLAAQKALGGKGSGNFGHAGRPGEVGGSGEGDERLMGKSGKAALQWDEWEYSGGWDQSHLTVTVKGKKIGGADVYDTGKSLFVGFVHVNLEYQNQGYGKVIAKELVHIANERSLPTISGESDSPEWRRVLDPLLGPPEIHGDPDYIKKELAGVDVVHTIPANLRSLSCD